MCKVLKLKYAYGTVPQDGLGVEDDLLPVLKRCFAGVHALPSVGNVVDVNSLAVSVVGETVAGYGSYREAQIHAFLLGSGDDVQSLGHQVVLVQRVADVATLCLDKGITHTTADDEVIHLVEQVLDNRQLR